MECLVRLPLCAGAIPGAANTVSRATRSSQWKVWLAAAQLGARRKQLRADCRPRRSRACGPCPALGRAYSQLSARLFLSRAGVSQRAAQSGSCGPWLVTSAPTFQAGEAVRPVTPAPPAAPFKAGYRWFKAFPVSSSTLAAHIAVKPPQSAPQTPFRKQPLERPPPRHDGSHPPNRAPGAPELCLHRSRCAAPPPAPRGSRHTARAPAAHRRSCLAQTSRPPPLTRRRPSPTPPPTPTAQSYPNFYAALSSTPDAKHTKRIVDTLSLQKTLSNPALKLTVFTPRDSALDALAARMRTSAAALTGNKGLMQQVGARCRQLAQPRTPRFARPTHALAF